MRVCAGVLALLLALTAAASAAPIVSVIPTHFNATASAATYPLPFTQTWRVTHPVSESHEVTILQTFLNRAWCRRTGPQIHVDGRYTDETAKAVKLFQHENHLLEDGVFGPVSAQVAIETCWADRYRDDGTMPSWAMYKILIQQPEDRTIEPKAIVFNKDHKPVFSYTVRTKGWHGRNMFTTNGDTPSGLGAIDLNAPFQPAYWPDYGPYPVNRLVKGLKGNMQLLIHDAAKTIRSGILMHTGQWKDWDPSKPMPDSHGCVHGHPLDVKHVAELLQGDLGVKMNENVGGQRPYPFHPQGVLSVEII